MKFPRRGFLRLAAGAAALPASRASRARRAIRSRPVRLIIGYTPGGSADITARLIGAMALGAAWPAVRGREPPGRRHQYRHRSGRARAADGYTLLLVAPANAINASLYDKLNYNFMRDIAPVAGIIRFPNVMEVNPSVPAKTVPEFIAYAKANPGKINMASSGNGSTIHVSGELFKMMTGIDMLHVPYRGGAPALTDLIGGQVQVMFDNLPTSIEHIRAGKLRALAVTSTTRSEAAAGHADGRRFRAGLRGERVVRPRRAEEHAGRDRQQAQQRDQRDPRRSHGEGAVRRAWAPR